MQWGTGQGTVTFPCSFKSNVYQGLACMGVNASCVPYANNYTTTTMYVAAQWARIYTEHKINWIVIGS